MDVPPALDDLEARVRRLLAQTGFGDDLAETDDDHGMRVYPDPAGGLRVVWRRPASGLTTDGTRSYPGIHAVVREAVISVLTGAGHRVVHTDGVIRVFA
ncbi:hypothetical protein [Planobispora longispora]|uniref:Uncharacterized protein n=1 Tax=Planobispora longispora TaxID=28887 RepID=A0A8J3RMG9_9ACTN|nr:hypothetical protein [Planobispora longispora]GIH77685.1 hypothetical protein Plo01_41140 [Planobispora longispora]